MKNGALLTGKKPRKKLHHYFGSISSLRDFNVDAGILMPDQDADGAPTECVGYTVTDIAADIDKRLYSPDWHYAQTLRLAGQPPSTDGTDPLCGMQVAVAQGFLPFDKALLSARANGELFCSNWKNWIGTAVSPKIDVYDASGNGDVFSTVLAACFALGAGISVATNWYPEWEAIGADGILPMPKSLSESHTGHNYAIKGQKTINSEPYWIVKSWQGKKYGDGGYAYMSRKVASAVFTMPGSVALAFVPKGSRWLGVAKICLKHLNAIPYLLPTLISLN